MGTALDGEHDFDEWERLKELIRARTIRLRFSSLGNTPHRFWAKESKIGCFLQALATLMIPCVVYTFFKWGWIVGLAGAVALLLSWRMIVLRGMIYTYSRILDNAFLFDALYAEKVFAIEIKKPKRQLVAFPMHWRESLKEP